MKYLKIVFINLLIFGLGSCDYRYGGEPYYDYNSQYTPVIMDRADLEQSIRIIGPREIKDFGKIYIKDSLLFINEKFEGIHVVDNSDPSNPENLAFIVIPGNIDISILNDVIYADNAVDLIAIKYTGDSVRVIDRNRNIFPELPAPEGQYYSYEGSDDRPENSVIVKWILK
jgi:hypothetical protein